MVNTTKLSTTKHSIIIIIMPPLLLSSSSLSKLLFIIHPFIEPLRFDMSPNYMGVEISCRLNIKTHLSGIGIPLIKLRRSHDHLISIMRILYTRKDRLYIENVPRRSLTSIFTSASVFSSMSSKMSSSFKCLVISTKAWAKHPISFVLINL